MKVGIPYDSTAYIQDAIDEVLSTLTETLIIVIIVIFLFLGSLRSVLIPVIAIPISLVGAVFLMLVAGFTINLLTLLAIVLSVGLVVDDAIVMVENVERHIHMGKTPVACRHRRRARTGRPDHLDDHHPRRCLRSDRYSGRPHGRLVPGVCVHARWSSHRFWNRRPDPIAYDGFEIVAFWRLPNADSPEWVTGASKRAAIYTRNLEGTLRYRPVVLTVWAIVARPDGSVLHVLAARTCSGGRSGSRVWCDPGLPQLNHRPDQALIRKRSMTFTPVPREPEHLSDHIAHRRFRWNGDQAMERAQEDRAATSGGIDRTACRRSPGSA